MTVGREDYERQVEDERRLVDVQLMHGLEEADGALEHLLAPQESHEVELYVGLVGARQLAVLAHQVAELVGRGVVERRRRAYEHLHAAALQQGHLVVHVEFPEAGYELGEGDDALERLHDEVGQYGLGHALERDRVELHQGAQLALHVQVDGGARTRVIEAGRELVNQRLLELAELALARVHAVHAHHQRMVVDRGRRRAGGR